MRKSKGSRKRAKMAPDAKTSPWLKFEILEIAL